MERMDLTCLPSRGLPGPYTALHPTAASSPQPVFLLLGPVPGRPSMTAWPLEIPSGGDGAFPALQTLFLVYKMGADTAAALSSQGTRECTGALLSSYPATSHCVTEAQAAGEETAAFSGA